MQKYVTLTPKNWVNPENLQKKGRGEWHKFELFPPKNRKFQTTKGERWIESSNPSPSRSTTENHFECKCSYTWSWGSVCSLWWFPGHPWHYMCSFPRFSHSVEISWIVSLLKWFCCGAPSIWMGKFCQQSTHYRTVPLGRSVGADMQVFVILIYQHWKLIKKNWMIVLKHLQIGIYFLTY